MRTKHLTVDIRTLWSLLRPRRKRQLCFLQILILVASFSEAANLSILLPFLELLSNPSERLKDIVFLSGLTQAFNSQQLVYILGLFFLLLVLISGVLRLVAMRSQTYLSAMIVADMSCDLFEKILYKPYPWHVNNHSSKTLSYLTKDIGGVSTSLSAVLQFLLSGTIALFISVSLIFVSPIVFISIVSVLFLFYGSYLLIYSKKIRETGNSVFLLYQRRLSIIQNALGGIRNIILDKSHENYLNDHSNVALKAQISQASINFKANCQRPIVESIVLIFLISSCLLMLVNGESIEQQIPIIGVFSVGILKLIQPIQSLSTSLTLFQSNRFAIKRVGSFESELVSPENWLKSNTSISKKFSKSKHGDGNTIIHFNNVSFQYSSDSSLIIKDLNLKIYKGEVIAFVGTTGSGKSTLMDLLLGLLSPSNGELLIDGIDINTNPEFILSWHQRIAHVPQSIFLSDGSFTSNIAFGINPQCVDFDRVVKASQLAQISSVIEDSLEGFDTVVGERGLKLSGGQRQRIAIARAFYKQADVFVLDEATSALDNITESQILKTIHDFDDHVTTIMVAHRLSTVEHCDRIVVLDKGVIVGMGTFDD